MRAIDRLNAARRKASKPTVTVDLALHLGEVQYGNVGAVDRLDFTVIGPAVNEVARIEALCEPLGCQVLVSAELAAAVGANRRLVPLGCHALRGPPISSPHPAQILVFPEEAHSRRGWVGSDREHLPEPLSSGLFPAGVDRAGSHAECHPHE